MKLKNVAKMVFLAAALVALPAVYHMQNHGIIPDRLRYSRTLTGTRGPFDGSRIQKKIIRYIVDICGEDLMLYHDPIQTAYPLERVLKRARDECEPTASIRQVRRWFNFWVDFAVTPVELKTKKQSARNMGRNHYKSGGIIPSGRSRWHTSDTVILRYVLENYPELYMEEMKDQVCILSGKTWSISHLYRQSRKLGYSLQKLFNRALQIDQDEQARYHAKLNLYLHHPEMMICLDETARNNGSGRRRRMWSKEGMTPVVESFFGTHGVRYSMLAAGDINGFVTETCEVVESKRGRNDSDPTRGTINRARFVEWITDKLLPVLGNASLFEPRSVVILDNATVHHSDEIIRLIRSVGAEVIFLPPYSPFLNPIEQFFNIYKRTLKKLHNVLWVDAHHMALDAVTSVHGNNFFYHCGVPGVNKLVDEDEGEEDLILIENIVAANSAAAVFVHMRNIKLMG